MTRTLVGLLIVAVGLGGCGAVVPGTAAEDDGGGASGEEPGGSGPDLPPTGARFGVINARIRNFTDLSADVTLRFSLFAQTVRLTVLRVPANISTSVIGPEEADLLEVSGVAQDGTALPEASFRYGVDFFAGTEAVYIIGTELDGSAIPPTLVFVEPIEDVEVVPGEPLAVVIADQDPDSSATIDFFLEPVDVPPAEGDGGTAGLDAGPGTSVLGLAGEETALATGLPEDLDGEGDSFSFTLPEDLAPGDYRLVGVIADELAVSIVRAPGVVQVTEAEGGQIHH